MSEKKIIAVIDSTGTQGGRLVRAILNDPNGELGVGVVTRHPYSEKEKEFAAPGAAFAGPNIDDERSLEKGFSDPCGAFWYH